MCKMLSARYEREALETLTITCLSMVSDKCIQNELI